jgi:hypothetical protein
METAHSLHLAKDQVDERLDKLTRSIEHLTIRRIADIVIGDWQNISVYAAPYLKAMTTFDLLSDKYYDDGGDSIVAYFLSNAKAWHGSVARIVKKELNARLKAYYNLRDKE